MVINFQYWDFYEVLPENRIVVLKKILTVFLFLVIVETHSVIRREEGDCQSSAC